MLSLPLLEAPDPEEVRIQKYPLIRQNDGTCAYGFAALSMTASLECFKIFTYFAGENLTSGDVTTGLNSMECQRTAQSVSSMECHKTVNSGNTPTEPKELELECDLLVRLAGPVLSVDLRCQGGRTGKDGAHQLLQYLKNKHAPRGHK
jgi:hypothetical protein